MWLIVTAVIMLATTAGLYGTDKGRKLRGRKKLVEQKQDGLAVLQKYGVRNGELILEEVMKAMKNEAVPQKRLKAPKKAKK